MTCYYCRGLFRMPVRLFASLLPTKIINSLGWLSRGNWRCRNVCNSKNSAQNVHSGTETPPPSTRAVPRIFHRSAPSCELMDGDGSHWPRRAKLQANKQ